MSKTYNLKTAFTHSSKENVEALVEYLQIIGGKTLTLACRRQNAFKTLWREKDINLISRCHVQNAADYLKAIKAEFSKEQITVVVADIAKYVKALDPNEDVSFIIVSTKTLPSAVHFDIAKRLFFNQQIREQNQNNFSLDILTIYSLRLSLESRVRGLLGIDYATSRGNNIGLSSLIKISQGLQAVEYSNSFNWTEIEWVNNWLNHHMHRHIRPYPWLIHQAIEILKPFVDPKEPILKQGKTIFSFYSATYVTNEGELENEIKVALNAEYPNIKIKWLSNREILKNKINE